MEVTIYVDIRQNSQKTKKNTNKTKQNKKTNAVLRNSIYT